MSATLEDALRPIVAKLVAEHLSRVGSSGQIKTPEFLRGAKKWTRKELAYRAGLAATTISDIERGNVWHLKHDTLEKIANALGVAETDYYEACLAVRRVRETPR